jgi:hypothetical protein
MCSCLAFAGDEKTKEPQEKAKAEQDAAKPLLAFNRRDKSTDEDLRKQLQQVPELGFDQNASAFPLAFLRKDTGNIASDFGPKFYANMTTMNKRADMNALPWRTGLDTELGKETAEELHVLSVNLRRCIREAVPQNDVRPDRENLNRWLTTKNQFSDPLAWTKAEAVPTLTQMLQTENTPVRLLMVDLLGKIPGKEAGTVLAQRAVFDLAPGVREKAVEALANRPKHEFQQTLLDALRWPWQPAADHAAEALAALQMKEAVPELVGMLKEPDPKLPFTKDKATFVREVVRINHLSNCLLCHAPSLSKDDLVRAQVPVPGESLTPPYYGGTEGSFVRADITFLRQDFSLVQPVTNPGKWPGHQRFDYLLRTRKATTKEVTLLAGLKKEKKLDDPYSQRDAVLFALRGITKTDMGSRTESWLPLLNPLPDPLPKSVEKKKDARQ